jgi:DNA-binding IclR family transcriptional regulator
MTARNWRNYFRNIENEFWIYKCIRESKKGLTFGELLGVTGLSKSVLTRHLKSMSSPKILILEGIGRERRYNISPAVKEKLAHHTAEEMVAVFIRAMLSHVPDKTLRNPEKRVEVVEEFRKCGGSRR